MSKFSFYFPISVMNMGTRMSEMYSRNSEKRDKSFEFSSQISLNSFDGMIKMLLNEKFKVFKYFKGI